MLIWPLNFRPNFSTLIVTLFVIVTEVDEVPEKNSIFDEITVFFYAVLFFLKYFKAQIFSTESRIVVSTSDLADLLNRLAFTCISLFSTYFLPKTLVQSQIRVLKGFFNQIRRDLRRSFYEIAHDCGFMQKVKVTN